METETLSSYEHTTGKHVVEDNDNMDGASISNDSDLHKTKMCEESPENAGDDIDLAATNHRSETQNNENEEEFPNPTANEQDDNEEVASDEEEDVPLNLEGSKSDNENISDDDLDDLDTFQNDQIDSDKEEIENVCASPSKETESNSEGNNDQVESDNRVVSDVENEDIGKNNVEQLQAETYEIGETNTNLQSDPLAKEESDPLLVEEVNDTQDKTDDKNEFNSLDNEDVSENKENKDENKVEEIETTKNDESELTEENEAANKTTKLNQVNTEKEETDLAKDNVASTSPEVIKDDSNNKECKDVEEKINTDVQPATEAVVENETNGDKNDIADTVEDPLALESKTETEASNQKPDEIKENADNDNSFNCPLLKETLSKPNESKQLEGDDDIEMDEDFDPSLLCPDIAMEVDEAPVITSNHEDTSMNNGNKSPLLYEPIFSTFVDEVTGAEISFNLTPEEEQLRQDTYGQRNPVHLTKIHCTACNIHLGSALDGQGNRFVHPLLKVLICKKCYHFYTSGEFEKDEDGSELYCRWCGQGGQVMCCANCEMVFCKKCIRINFDRKKIAQIKDSEDWLCFRCNPSQITHLKLHCAEFMEYVRRETSRVATLENAVEYMKVDHCRCCLPQKKKAPPEATPSQPVKKKRKTITDPDYDPFRDRDSPQPSTSGFTSDGSKSINIPPKETDPNRNGGIVKINKPATAPINLFKPRNPTTIVKPRVPVVTAGTTNSANSSFVKIMPGGVRLMGTVAPSKPTTSNTSARAPVRPNRLSSNTNMKHEWFEKTVRAAARVNSNLSYTLTQLNRAQATASSVEALAVVHNKLQEILSTSINSLIQIRKNLRTEFIQGIKNIRFPAKPAPTPPPPPPSASNSSQDDDVIFISPSSSPVPPPLTPTVPSTIVNQSPPPLFPVLGPEVSLTKTKSPVVSAVTKPVEPMATTSKVELERPKTFLRVKSLTALQNVPSECITIPDDLPPLVPVSKHNDDDVTIIEDTPEENKSQLTNGVSNGENHKDSDKKDSEVLTYTADNLKQPHSKELKRIMRMSVVIHKSPKIDNMVRNLYGSVNGNAFE